MPDAIPRASAPVVRRVCVGSHGGKTGIFSTTSRDTWLLLQPNFLKEKHTIPCEVSRKNSPDLSRNCYPEMASLLLPHDHQNRLILPQITPRTIISTWNRSVLQKHRAGVVVLGHLLPSRRCCPRLPTQTHGTIFLGHTKATKEKAK